MTWRLTLSVATFLLLASCWQRRETLNPPDLSGQNSEVEQTIVRLQEFDESLQGEVESLRAAMDAFFDEPRSSWSPPFPLDAFRHASMSCLNTPPSAPEPEPTLALAAERYRIVCAPPALVALEQRIGEQSGYADFAKRKLGEVDRIRSARTTVQNRLRQIPEIIRRARNYLAVRRSEARQLEADTERRRTEYRKSDYDEAIDRIRRHRRALDRLDESIGELEQAAPRRSRELGDAVDRLYKEMSRLGHPEALD